MRMLVPSGSPYEKTVGFSRAVRDGNQVFVAGTAPVMPEAGATLDDVVRTRIFLVDPADWEEVGRAHGEFFGEIRPASTMLAVSALIDPRWRVEIEADAVLQM